MRTVRIQQHLIIGSEINETIAMAIRQAQVESCLVSFDFNSVGVTVEGTSDPALIYRDWNRAMQGMVDGSKVGPHPGELTEAEIANDARVKVENDARRVEREEAGRREAEIGKAAVDTALSDASALDVINPEGWAKGLAANTDSYGRCIFDFAEAWGRLMQTKIAEGHNLADVADECCSLADKKFGITGFMYGAAVSILAQVWRYGPDLNRWHNAKYGREDAEGTVNPAVLTIGPKAA